MSVIVVSLVVVRLAQLTQPAMMPHCTTRTICGLVLPAHVSYSALRLCKLSTNSVVCKHAQLTAIAQHRITASQAGM